MEREGGGEGKVCLGLSKGLTKGIMLVPEERELKVSIDALGWDARQKPQAVPAPLQKSCLIQGEMPGGALPRCRRDSGMETADPPPHLSLCEHLRDAKRYCMLSLF